LERGSSPGGYLATSVDQLVTLLFAKYAREVAKALPGDKEHPPHGSENARRVLLTA
jgi:predicted SAM-dependent methyltransferase